MKAVMVPEVGRFDYTDIPEPEVGDGEVLVEVEVTGLCRTDLKIIEHGHRDLTLPRVPGEEVVGRIAHTGRNVQNISAGDRVWVYPGLSCGNCPRCLRGAENLCSEMRIMGFHRDGGFARFVSAPAASLIHVPEGLSLDEAVLAEPLSCCLNALEMSGLREGEALGIWGGGPAGILLQRAGQALGARPTVIDPDPKRRGFASGITEPGDDLHFDVCVVAVGAPGAYESALACLAPRGRLVIFSGLLPDAGKQEVSFNRIHYLEQSLVGAYGCSLRHGRDALNLIAAGRVHVRDMISHRLPLSELAVALDLVRNRSGMKILLYPEREGYKGGI